jgi:hypothetical protein
LDKRYLEIIKADQFEKQRQRCFACAGACSSVSRDSPHIIFITRGSAAARCSVTSRRQAMIDCGAPALFLVSRVVTNEGLKGVTDETAHHRGRNRRNSRRQQRVRPKFSIAGQRTRGPDSGPTDGWPPANYRPSNHNWTGPCQGSWFSGDVTIWRQGRCNRCAESRSCAARHSRWTKRASRLTDRRSGFWRRMDRLQDVRVGSCQLVELKRSNGRRATCLDHGARGSNCCIPRLCLNPTPTTFARGCAKAGPRPARRGVAARDRHRARMRAACCWTQ